MRIYTDESRTQADQGPYMVIGGIICDKDTSKKIRKKIQGLKVQENLPPTFEFHFTTMQPKYIEVYKRLIDIFVDIYNQKCHEQRGLGNNTYQKRIFRKVCFEAMLVEHSKINHNKFSQGDKELGFFRFYYTLLAHTLQKYFVDGVLFHITIDAIRTTDAGMVPSLHRRLISLGLHPSPNIMRQDSKEELLLQMADVMLGVVSFAWNVSPTASNPYVNAKREVVQYTEEKLNISLSKTTYPGKSFNIWKLILK